MIRRLRIAAFDVFAISLMLAMGLWLAGLMLLSGMLAISVVVSLYVLLGLILAEMALEDASANTRDG